MSDLSASAIAEGSNMAQQKEIEAAMADPIGAFI